jgi:hypothetical protein
MANMSENAVKLLNFLKSTTEDVTVHDISAQVGLPVNSITGTFNSFVKKGLGERVAAEVELEDGTHKAVKILKLTEAGMAYDPTAVEAAE